MKKDERHRKIGRNLVLLQKVEMWLKAIILKGNLTLQLDSPETPAPSVEAQLKQQEKAISGKPLGVLEKQFIKSTLSAPLEFPHKHDLDSTSISLGVSVGTKGMQDRLTNDLASVRSGRNRLVHELYTSFELCTNEGLGDLDIFLEQQYKSLLPLVKELEAIYNLIIKSLKQASFSFDDFKIPQDSYRLDCATKLVVCLCVFEVGIKKKGDFEWISLAAAKKFLNRHFPEAIPECRKHYNCKSLKKILRKIGVFDVQRLPTDHGKEMVFYRMKHQYSIEEDEDGDLYLCNKYVLKSGESNVERVSLGRFFNEKCC